jgi:hypothetical protein
MKQLGKLSGYPGVPLESSPIATISDIDGLWRCLDFCIHPFQTSFSAQHCMWYVSA